MYKDLIIKKKILSDAKNVLIGLVLPSILQTTKKMSTRGSNKKVKISIENVRQSFIVHLTDSSQLPGYITKLTDQYLQEKRKIQPFIVAVGPTVFTIETYFIFYFGTYYKYESFLKALDTCFKLFFTLQIEYPIECELIWTFIQKYFFKINLKTDVTNSKLLTVLADLKKTDI